MQGLVHNTFASARERTLSQTPPPFFLNRAAPDLLCRHLAYECVHVVAHEVELMDIIAIRRVERHFRRRKGKDEPTSAYVDTGESDDVAKERSIGFRILRVDGCGRTRDDGR